MYCLSFAFTLINRFCEQHLISLPLLKFWSDLSNDPTHCGIDSHWGHKQSNKQHYQQKNQATTLNHLFWLWHHLWIESLHYYYCQVYFIRSSYLCLWLSCRATVINILQKKYQVNLGPKWVIYNENILLNKTFNFVSLSMQKGNRFPFTITCIILKYGSLKKQK